MNESERKDWCGKHCPERVYFNGSVKEFKVALEAWKEDVRSKVSVRVFIFAMTLIGVIVSGIYGVQWSLSQNISAVKTDTVMIREVQLILKDTLKEIKTNMQRHSDLEHKRRPTDYP